MSEIVWFDLIIVALVLVLGVKGLVNGFVKEVFGLIGLIGGVVMASRFALWAGEIISTAIYQLNESAQFFFGFLTVLILFWAACLATGSILSKALRLSGLGVIDRLLGFVAGSAKIFLVLAIFAAIVARIGVLNSKIEPYFQNSIIYPALLITGQFIMNQDYLQINNSVKSAVAPVLDANVSTDDNTSGDGDDTIATDGEAR